MPTISGVLKIDLYGIAEGLYHRLPVGLQNLIVSYVGWRKWRQRFGGTFYEILENAIEREAWSHEQIIEFQKERWLAFVRHAAENVPFYKRKFAALGLRADDIQTYDDYRQLPILTKQEVQDNLKELRALLGRSVPLHRENTSGTTGTGLRFVATVDSNREHWAVKWRYRMRHGITRDLWSVFLTSKTVVPAFRRKPPFWRTHYPGKTVFFSIFHLSAPNMDAYLAELRRRNLPWIHGFPSALVLLAQAAIERSWEPPSNLRWVTSDSEQLFPWQKEMIERAFEVRVFDHYGLAEDVAFFSECTKGKLHVDEDFAYVEFLPHPNDEGVKKIIGTNISNPAFPLLRYDTGDLAVLSDEGCDCGLPGRIVKEVQGRDDEYVITPSGVWLGRLNAIFGIATHVRNAQIVQKRLDWLVLRIERREGYDQHEEELILKIARDRVGPEMRIEIEYVDEIPRTKAGKFRYVISELNPRERKLLSLPES